MIKYHAAALALKGFSCCKPARNLYRGLGNWLGARKRTVKKMPSYYLERAERNIFWCRKYAPLRAEDLVLELGTGWVHPAPPISRPQPPGHRVCNARAHRAESLA
jgi:hypothetical protein